MSVMSRLFAFMILNLCLVGAAHAGRVETRIQVDLRDQTGQPVEDWVNVSLMGTRAHWMDNPYPPFLPVYIHTGYEAVSLYSKADSQGRVSVEFVGDYDGTPALSLYIGIFYRCDNRREGTTTSGHQYSDFRTDSGATCLVRYEGEEALAEITGERHLRMTCTLATTREQWQRARVSVIEEYERTRAASPGARCQLLQ